MPPVRPPENCVPGVPNVLFVIVALYGAEFASLESM